MAFIVLSGFCFWHFVIITFIILLSPWFSIFCIILKTFACIIALLDYPQAIKLLRSWVILEKSRYQIGVLFNCYWAVVQLLSLCLSKYSILLSLSKYDILVLIANFILLEYLVNNGCIYLTSVNHSQRWIDHLLRWRKTIFFLYNNKIFIFVFWHYYSK